MTKGEMIGRIVTTPAKLNNLNLGQLQELAKFLEIPRDWPIEIVQGMRKDDLLRSVIVDWAKRVGKVNWLREVVPTLLTKEEREHNIRVLHELPAMRQFQIRQQLGLS